MAFIKLALQNMVRRKLRTSVTLTGVAVAVAALFSLLAFQRGYQTGMRDELDRLGAHVLVVPKGCPYDAASTALHGASWPCYLKYAYLEQVRKTRGVSVAAPVFMNALYEANGNQTVYLGINDDIQMVKRAWSIEGSLPVKTGDILLGAAAAKSLRVQRGQEFDLPGLEGAKGRVCGLLATTQGADDNFLYMPLADAQRLFKRQGQLTHILVRLQDPNSLEDVVGALRACEAGMDMNIVPLTHLFRTIQSMVNSTRLLLGCIALVALLVAGAGVSNTVLMAVTERTREIGVMRSVGASMGDIFRLIWMETVQICLLGGVAGVAVALVGAQSLEGWLRSRLPFAPTGTLIHPEASIIVACLAGAALLGSLAGLLPAWRASRLSPVEAIRVT